MAKFEPREANLSNLTDFESARARAKSLAGEWVAASWYELAVSSWPGPIAHEIEAIAAVLEGEPYHQDGGDAGAALLQFRDATETIIKFLALAVARDVINRGDLATRQAMRRLVMEREPSLGGWVRILRDGVGLAVSQGGSDAWVTGAIVAGWAGSKRLRTVTNDLPGVRNRLLGHGVLRANPLERIAVVEEVLFGRKPSMNKSSKALPCLATLIAACHDARVFAGLAMIARAPGLTGDFALTGRGSIALWHQQSAPGHQATINAEVLLVRSGIELGLAPYVLAEVCEQCGHRDVFLFDGLRDDAKAGKFDLKDWPHGHDMTRPGEKLVMLGRELLDAKIDVAAWKAAQEAEYLGKGDHGAIDGSEMTVLLDSLSFDARYLKPDHLYKATHDFLAMGNRGLLWLQMPAHTGKTMFCRGIGDPRAAGDKWRLEGEPLVASVFIRREMRFDAVGIGSALHNELIGVLDIRPEDRARCPFLDTTIDVARRPGAFLAMLEGLLAQRGQASRERALVIVIDGLDELKDPLEGGVSFSDFIPGGDRLPKGVYVILTSRIPGQSESPFWLLALQERLRDGASIHVVRTIDDSTGKKDDSYVEVLGHYIVREIGKAPQKIELSGSQRARLIEVSDGRFLFLSFFVDRLIAGEMVPADIDALTINASATIDERELVIFQKYLRDLPRSLGSSKLANQALRILCVIRAFEDGHDWLFDSEPGGGAEPDLAFREEGDLDLAFREGDTMLEPVAPHFRGVPLDIVAQLCEALVPGREGRSAYRADFVYALGRLKAVLGIWRGGDATSEAKYFLWARGLGPAVASEAKNEIRTIHGDIASLALETAAAFRAKNPPYEVTGALAEETDIPAVSFLWPYALCQAVKASCASEIAAEELQDIEFLSGAVGQVVGGRGQTVEQTYWFSNEATLKTFFAKQKYLSGSKQSQFDPALIAKSYRNLGEAHFSAGRVAKAISCYTTAIALCETAGDDDSFLPRKYEVAVTLMRRGIAHDSAGSAVSGMVDATNAEIGFKALLHVLKELGFQVPAKWRSDFASVLVAKGLAQPKRLARMMPRKHYLDGIEEAVRIRRSLVEDFGEKTPAAWRYELAATVLACGRVLADIGSDDEAIVNYSNCIDLLTQLVDELGVVACPVVWRITKSTALTNRGESLKNRGKTIESLNDIEEAINLLYDIVARAPQFMVSRSALSAAHLARANLRNKNKEWRLAILDLDVAIEALVRITSQLGEGSSPKLRYDLLNAYHDRAKAHLMLEDEARALSDATHWDHLGRELAKDKEVDSHFQSHWHWTTQWATLNKLLEKNRRR